MKRLPYALTNEAHSDLDEIWTYTAQNWSVKQADRYFNLIIDEINYICTNTAAGRSMDHVKESYRASKVKSHLIFYRALGDKVEIIRILHERMDIENRLSPQL